MASSVGALADGGELYRVTSRARFLSAFGPNVSPRNISSKHRQEDPPHNQSRPT